MASAVTIARIAWHAHLFDHTCYGPNCPRAMDLYRRYLETIKTT